MGVYFRSESPAFQRKKLLIQFSQCNRNVLEAVEDCMPSDRGSAILQVLNRFDEEFAAILEENRREALPDQEREPV